MLLKLLAEIVLAFITYLFARQFWHAFKRDLYLKLVMDHPAFLESVITKESLDHLESLDNQFRSVSTQPQGKGYDVNIYAAQASDVRAALRFKILFAVLLGVMFRASYSLGNIYLVINIAVFLLTFLTPISEPAKKTALDYVISLAYILRCWHKKNSSECKRWIEEKARTLRPIYEAVKKVS